MRRASLFCCLCVLLLLLGCRSKEAKTIEGTWQMVSGRYITPSDTVICSDESRLCYKLIGANHFSVVEMYRARPDSAFFAAVGRYTLHDSVYTEILEGCSNPNMVGISNVFQSSLLGDTWRIYRENEDGSLDETWKRVRSGS